MLRVPFAGADRGAGGGAAAAARSGQGAAQEGEERRDLRGSGRGDVA